MVSNKGGQNSAINFNNDINVLRPADYRLDSVRIFVFVWHGQYNYSPDI